MRLDIDNSRFMPELHLFHNRKKCVRFIKRIGGCSMPIDGKDAQTWFFGGSGKSVAVVLFEADADWYSEAALLAHEAVHVALDIARHIGIEDDEVIAYTAQDVADGLFRAHDEWKRGKLC